MSACKVLVVEDNQEIREAVVELLRSEGHEVREAPNGRIGLAMATASRPDAILLDMMMPVMDGQQFLDARANLADLREVPVVVMTAHAALRKPKGVSLLLRKPFDIRHVIEAVDASCAQRSRAASS